MRRALATAALALGAVALGAPASASDSEDSITAFDMVIDLGADGVAHVALDIDADFGVIANHGPYLTWVITQRFDDKRNREYHISHFTASSPDAADDVSTEDLTYSTRADGDVTERAYKIGSPDSTVTGVHHYTISFDVDGWVNPADYAWPTADPATPTPEASAEGAATPDPATPDRRYDLLYVNLITGWNIPVRDATVTVTGPAEVLDAACFDVWESDHPCDRVKASGTTAAFTQSDVPAGQPLTVAIAYPRGTFPGVEPIVVYRWSFARAFALTPWTVGGALAVVAAGGLVLMRRLRRTGRDDQFLGLTPGVLPAPGQVAQVGGRRRAPIAVQFSPPEGFRAGQLGTLVDETADPQDVTATIIDLAVRGYLRITQVAGGGDWLLERTPRPTDDLLAYESQLHAQIFAGRESVELSALRTTFSTSMTMVQTALYADVVERGWFRSDPRAARSSWAVRGTFVLLAGIGATLLLAVQTQWALLGIALVLVGIAWLGSTKAAPARTASGTAVLVQAEGFRQYLATAEANQLRFEEGEDLFSRYLPYAVAFGLTERWANLFAQLAAQGRALAVPGWYVGYSGIPFWAAAGSLGTDLSRFTSTTESALTAPAPSASGASGASGFGGGGFGGGGFGGGGVGGGGGGTW